VFKKINYLLISFLAPLICLISCAPKNEPVLKVAVATNFLTTADTLAEVFERSTGIEVLLISGSSGQLATQVINGAPYDIFLSADHVNPFKLSSLGFADAQTQLTYALGQLVLFGAGDVEQNLKSGNFLKLALANPKVAPYGLAADHVINDLNIRSNVEGKIVFGQNVGQAYGFVKTGNADLAFVALSQVQGTKKSYWRIPQSFYTPIMQDAILLRPGLTNKVAHDFLSFLSSDEARKIIIKSGYEVPQND